jgi:hypothetical protein
LFENEFSLLELFEQMLYFLFDGVYYFFKGL